MHSRKPVTMKEIAEAAGVTTSTVSLVFRRKPEVSAATRERILAIAKELGYHADPYVATLVNNRRKGKLPASSPVLAFATAHATPDGWREHSSTFVSYFEGARMRAAEKGFRLETFWLGKNGCLARRASEIFYARNISGVLLAPLPDSISSLDLDWNRFHAVALGFSLTRPLLTRVASDHLQSVALAVRRCHALGYRRIGMILTLGNHNRIEWRWIAALLLEQERLKGLERVQPLVLPEFTVADMLDWLDRERPEVVLSHYSGGALHRHLIASGRRVPEDIGLVDLNSPGPEGFACGVFENPFRLGARAIDLLIGGVQHNEFGIPPQRTTLLIDGTWVPGDSLLNDRADWEASAGERIPGEPQRVRRVSMRDIADRAGVSPAAVSLCFKDSPRVSDETKSRIRKIADQLGYRKNPYLSELMRNRRNGRIPLNRPILGFITSAPTRDGWHERMPLFHRYLIGAEGRAEAHGFRLKEFWLADPALKPDPVAALRRRNIQGLLLAPTPADSASLALPWNEFCLVAFGFTLPDLKIYRVASDPYSAMLHALRECHARGYRRVGFALTADADAWTQHRWAAAFLVYRREHPDRVTRNYLLLKDWQKDPLRRWLARERPDALLVPSNDPVTSWLRTWNIRVPGDLGLVTLNWDPQHAAQTGIDQNGELLGSRAVDVLVGLIERNEYGRLRQPNTLFVDGIWKSGETLPAIPRR